MRILNQFSAEAVQQTTAAAAGAASMTASLAASEWATWLFGVPMVVLLAAFAGACFALSIVPRKTFWGAVVTVLLGTALGAYGEPALQYVLGFPEGVAPGAAFGLAFVLPALVPIVVKKAPDWADRVVRHIFYRGGNGGGDDNAA